MAIKHFKASEHSPESASGYKVEDHVTASSIDKIVHAQSANEGHRLLPTVFTIEKGNPIASKAIGPGALYVIEGEFIVEDAAHPETQLHLTAGDVILVDEGTVEKISSPSKGRGFGIAYIPAPLVLEDLRTK